MKKFFRPIIINSTLPFVGLLVAFSCGTDVNNMSPNDITYKQEMREFVIKISEYSKSFDANFKIIPQNGIELVSANGEQDGQPHAEFLNAIDGNGQEDLFYGYDKNDQPTSNSTNSYLRAFLDISKNAGNTILVTDYCSTPAKMDDSYSKNNMASYVSYAADQRELNNIANYPSPIYAQNNDVIRSFAQVQNFLYLINPENYITKTAFINAITATNYDLVIMDLFFHDGTEFTSSEINQLKNKLNGGKRLVICYMSIGEAENYRYYWQTSWSSDIPSWMDAENPDWAGNFQVKYWDEEWQSIICGNDSSYSKKILTAQFDGVYLDIVDAFENYE